jgi:hypothetical protein
MPSGPQIINISRLSYLFVYLASSLWFSPFFMESLKWMCDWKEALLAIQLADLWQRWRPQIVFQLAVRENVLWFVFFSQHKSVEGTGGSVVVQSFLLPPNNEKDLCVTVSQDLQTPQRHILAQNSELHRCQTCPVSTRFTKRLLKSRSDAIAVEEGGITLGISILLRGARILKYNLACCKSLHGFQDTSTLKVPGLALLPSPRWQCVMVENWLGQRPTLILQPENDGFFLWKRNSKANFMKHKDGWMIRFRCPPLLPLRQ